MFAKIHPNLLIAGAVLLVGLAIFSISKQLSAPRETINLQQMAAPPDLPEKRSGKQP